MCKSKHYLFLLLLALHEKVVPPSPQWDVTVTTVSSKNTEIGPLNSLCSFLAVPVVVQNPVVVAAPTTPKDVDIVKVGSKVLDALGNILDRGGQQITGSLTTLYHRLARASADYCWQRTSFSQCYAYLPK